MSESVGFDPRRLERIVRALGLPLAAVPRLVAARFPAAAFTERSLRRWRSGATVPTAAAVCAMARVLGVTMEDLCVSPMSIEPLVEILEQQRSRRARLAADLRRLAATHRKADETLARRLLGSPPDLSSASSG